jgi:phage terminase Nu1 subunit (DNA packaging protein)
VAGEKAVISAAELAKLWKISPARVHQLHRDEGMPIEGRGRYDFVSCCLWYIAWLQDRARVGGVTPKDETKDQRARLTSAEATLKEIEIARQRRELIPVADVVKIWDDALGSVRARLLGSVSATASRCLGLKTLPQAHEAIEGVIHEALREAAGVAEKITSASKNGRSGVH